MNLEDKVAIVTCGASGTGREIVRCLLQNRIQHVVIFDIHLMKAKRACDELSLKYGKGRIIYLNVDITNEWEFETAFHKVRNEFQKVDILVNNSDIALSKEVQTIINKNMCTEIGLKLLESKGILLNICKLNALSNLYYATTKDGLLAYTKEMSHWENSRFIRVLTLNPGFTEKDTLSEFVKNETIAQDNLRNIHSDIGTLMLGSVGRVAVYLIRYGENGSTYSVNNGKLKKLTLNQDENAGEEIEYN